MLLPRREVEQVNSHLDEARKTSEYLHDLHERNLNEDHRTATERDRRMFNGRAFLRKFEEEKHERGLAGTNYPCPEGNDGTSIELLNANLKKFDQPWEDTLTSLEKEPEGGLLGGRLSCKMPQRLYHSDQVHCKEPKSSSRLNAMASGASEQSQSHP